MHLKSGMSSEIQQPPKTYLVASGSSFGIPYINSRAPSTELQTGHFFMLESYREPLTRGAGIKGPNLIAGRQSGGNPLRTLEVSLESCHAEENYHDLFGITSRHKHSRIRGIDSIDSRIY